MQEKIRLHLFVSGRVQGVMFRKHAQKEAQNLGIGGWAHNVLDGRVEIVVEGKKNKAEQFVEWCKKGSPLAKVEKVEVEKSEYKGEFKSFEIREFGF